MAPGRYELSEAQWQRIKDMLPGRLEHVGRRNSSPTISRSREVTLRIHFEHARLVHEPVLFIARGDVVKGCVALLD
jgi:hypothetical protein